MSDETVVPTFRNKNYLIYPFRPNHSTGSLSRCLHFLVFLCEPKTTNGDFIHCGKIIFGVLT